MEKIELYTLTEEEISNRSTGKDDRRNLLGYIKTSELEEKLNCLQKAFQNVGVSITRRDQTYGYTVQPRVELLSCDLFDFIRDLQKTESEKNYPIGFFLEPVVAHRDESGMGVEDKDRMAVIIYFTIKKKALTALRNFCFEHIFEMKKEAVV